MSEPVHNFSSAYDTYAKFLAEANEANKHAVFAALKQAGISTVEVRFDGEGDSGQIDSITAFADDVAVALPKVKVAMRHATWDGISDGREMRFYEAIEELCFDYLSREHAGWENNDGGDGEFTFRVEDSSIDLEFQEFHRDSTSYSHTF